MRSGNKGKKSLRVITPKKKAVPLKSLYPTIAKSKYFLSCTSGHSLIYFFSPFHISFQPLITPPPPYSPRDASLLTGCGG